MTKTALTIFLLAASPVAAQDVFSLPQGCEAYLTIQSQSCTVSHHFTCEGDAEGDQRRASLDEEGLSYVGRINSEAEWVESFHLRSGHTERLMQSDDRMLMSELLDRSSDTFDFTTDSREIGESRYVGQDTLTGERVVIDGITLLRTAYEIIAYDDSGNEIWRAAGNEYINPDWRMFMGGVSTYETSSGTFETDDSPVEFIFPGEAGFMSVNPKFGCGVVMSSFDAPAATDRNTKEF